MTRPPRAPSVPSFTTEDNGVTFLVVSAAGVAYDHTLDRIEMELDLGRRVNVIPTPTAATWLDGGEIERLTGWPMRPQQRLPHAPTFDPPASKVVASPVTLNTLTKWAGGHGDNLALSLLNEASGTPGLPVFAEVSLSQAYADHAATDRAIGDLVRMGVAVSRSPFGGARLLFSPNADVVV